MAKFRKKPVVIEAVKVPMREYADAPMVFEELPEWLAKAVECGTIRAEFRSEDYYYFIVDTLEGSMTATPGDMIIRGVKGELYPCKPDIFAATYDPVAPVSSEKALTALDWLAENGWSNQYLSKDGWKTKFRLADLLEAFLGAREAQK